MLAHLISSNNC